MLEVQQLSRRYGDYVAVDKVSFTIGHGEICGLLGHNGAGKTTIMKMLSGYLEPDAGSITVDGLNLAQNPLAVQRQLGYLPESMPLYPELCVVDYLDYAAELKGLQGADKTAEIRRVIGATSIADRLTQPVATLSRGYKQRTGVAQALLGSPRLLILDEPTNGLDPEQTAHMRELIREISRSATVILSTHIMQEVEALCTRALILRDGKVAVDRELAELRCSNHLRLVVSFDNAEDDTILSVDGITECAAAGSTETGQEYRLTLAEGANMSEVSAELARRVVNAGYDLRALHPEYRDLETLFREVSEYHATAGGFNDAA